jgi:hypothetical protein
MVQAHAMLGRRRSCDLVHISQAVVFCKGSIVMVDLRLTQVAIR